MAIKAIAITKKPMNKGISILARADALRFAMMFPPCILFERAHWFDALFLRALDRY